MPPKNYYNPSLHKYAALRMDPVATVGAVSGADKQALDAARAIQPKTYLVYIDKSVIPADSSRPWGCYSVMPVASSLRPADEEHRDKPTIGPLPIAPNADHLLARVPLETKPAFPFYNCYHWDRTALTVRVRAHPSGWDEHAATALCDPGQLASYFSSDDKAAPKSARQLRFEAGMAANKWIEAPLVGTIPPPNNPDGTPTHPSAYPDRWNMDQPLFLVVGGSFPEHPSEWPQGTPFTQPTLSYAHQTTPQSTRIAATRRDNEPSASTSESGEADTRSGGSRSTANTSVDSFAESLHVLQAVTALPDLREQAEDADLLPVVDMWYELTAHLAQGEIPSPLDFYRERHEIVKIVREARKRAADRQPDTPAAAATVVPAEYAESPQPAELQLVEPTESAGPSRPADYAQPTGLAKPVQAEHATLDDPAHSQSDHEEAGLEPRKPKPRRVRPLKNLRQLRQRALNLLERAATAARPMRSRFAF
ncbi:hypothetical protein L226DRAFT_494867 [Lentinus tigrinus ALCF2SS1-7]|uniref:Uncharacterized protein n=1 Tax=Lentinus tigrinus ALCF2SS1-6 TaxID=1328759 RepID=A0A5C2S4N9_9APHY|nr:hypothetical protein L227DRAFT_529601 [Lentinus tigrinus ALCF2SS1-6]RPD69003.1 hypothetical protein L226DRAFT_494867 [Lentinus tigrinus ALCF2SS1-7]